MCSYNKDKYLVVVKNVITKVAASADDYYR